jgi:hypothetical protein
MLIWFLQMCIISVNTPKYNCLCLCVEQHQHYALLAWHASYYFILLDQISLILQISWYTLLAPFWCPRFIKSHGFASINTDFFYIIWIWREYSAVRYGSVAEYVASFITRWWWYGSDDIQDFFCEEGACRPTTIRQVGVSGSVTHFSLGQKIFKCKK